MTRKREQKSECKIDTKKTINREGEERKEGGKREEEGVWMEKEEESP